MRLKGNRGEQGSAGQAGEKGSTIQGSMGQPGPQGLAGPVGLPGKGLALLKVDYLSTVGTGLYEPPQGTTSLYVMLWGSGGGGGGCDTGSTASYQIGAGGGGGGYAEGWINPMSQGTFKYKIGQGGYGGVRFSSGRAGQLTWFGSPEIISAIGGQGGGVFGANASGDLLARTITGGLGGAGYGKYATITATACPGGQGFGWVRVGGANIRGILIGGQGGAAGIKSGFSPSVTTTSAGSVAGTLGSTFGGGGGGACSFGSFNGTPAADGGDGANGFIVVYAYS